MEGGGFPIKSEACVERCRVRRVSRSRYGRTVRHSVVTGYESALSIEVYLLLEKRVVVPCRLAQGYPANEIYFFQIT